MPESTNPAAAAPKKSGGTVTVACKLPNGLLAEVMDNNPDHAMKLPDGQGGTRLIYRRIPYPGNEDGRLFLRGSAAQRRIERADDNGLPSSMIPIQDVASGFGLTTGVDEAWITAWFEQNQEYPPVKRGLIFMQKNTASARDQAADHAGIKNGFEPLNPAKPAAEIEPTNEKLKAA